jgi:phage protein D
MANETLVIEIDGAEATDLYDDLVQLEVETCHELPATFQLQIALYKEPGDEGWAWVDEPRLRVWSEVTIRVGFDGSDPEDLIHGYVTRVVSRFAEADGTSVLEVHGVDASVRMDREEKLKAWPDKKDSDIAREILGEHGFDPVVEDTDVVHEEALSTVIQRETDLQFLQRLAKRNGYHCYVEGTSGYFRPVPADDAPQPLLAAHFGDETNLRRFAVTVDALRPAEVAMYQVDRFTREVLFTEAVAPAQPPLGASDPAALLPRGVDPGRVYVARNAATGTPEMSALCHGLFRAGAWLVEGEGEIDAAAYQHVLRPRALVTIKGLGETHSGVYYVCFVRHVIDQSGYTEHFRVKRDALLPTGDEDFEAGGGLGLF